MSEVPPEIPSGVESRYGTLSRTWELELLVSGAVFFSLLQVPKLIDQLFARVEVHFPSQTYILAMFGYLYAKSIIYVLIASFLTHLASRAYWVGLVGLDSVFPKGVKWDKDTNYGPISRAILRERLPSLPATIAALDNFCSVIFGFAFSIVFLFLYSVALATLSAGLAWVLARVVPGVSLDAALKPILIVLATYPALLITLDKRGWIKPDSSAARALRMLLRFSVVSVLGIIGAGFLTLLTNLPKRVIRPMIFLVIMGTFVVVGAETIVRRSGTTTIGQWFIPAEPGPGTIDYQFYEDRGAGRDPRVPTIQSDVITQPYVRLQIPYYARRDNDVLAHDCRGVNPKQLESDDNTDPDPRATAAVLQCVARLRDIRLDDTATPVTQLQFYRDPNTGLTGFVTYIPTSTLTRGHHVLVVKRLPQAGDDPKKPRLPYRIWFWL